jgi:hypothetical protein
VVTRRTPAQVRGPAEHLVTGTGDAPGRSSRLLRSRRPRHLASATPVRQAVPVSCRSSSPTDPALPGGSAWEKFYARHTRCHKVRRHFSFRYFEFRRVIHKYDATPPQIGPGSPQVAPELVDVSPSRHAMTRRTGPAVRVAMRPVTRLGFETRRALPRFAAGARNARRALIGMSDKGPSLAITGTSPDHALTGPVTLPVDPVFASDPGSLRHPATAAPPRQAGEALYGSSSPTDPALLGRSAWEKFYAPKAQCHKGFRRISFTYLEFRRVVHNSRCLLHSQRPRFHRM